MATYIDENNFHLYLVQSSQGRAGIPDGNWFFDEATNTIELIGDDELASFVITDTAHPSYTDGVSSFTNELNNFEGINLRALYNFENERRRNNETLRTLLRSSQGTYRFAGAFDFINGVKLDDTVLGDGSTDRNKIRGSGWVEYAASGNGKTNVDRIYHGNVSLSPIQATTQARFALVTDTLEATLQAATWTDYSRLGPVNEAVQVFGSTAHGDTGAGSFDYTTRTLVIRVRSWAYNPEETTSVATGIPEFSGFSAGYGVGESQNPANTFALADVFGGAQVAPWTGMTLEKLGVAQTETGFNESDGNFTWVLHNTLGGTAQQCAAYLDALTLQDADIDAGAGNYNGQKGRVWYNRDADGNIVTVSAEGEGLFIEGLSTAEQQNVIMTDDTAAAKTYPFFPEIQVEVGSAAVADTNAWYHMYYVDGAATADFDTSNAVTVRDKDGNPIKGVVNTDAVGTKINKAYAYDTDTDAGLSAGQDKSVVIIVEGDGGVAQAITYFTITRDTIVPVTCSPSADNNA